MMFKFVLGVVTGIVICTVGVAGIFHVLDKGVSKVQEVAKEAAE
jgi:hypothetical protein